MSCIASKADKPAKDNTSDFPILYFVQEQLDIACFILKQVYTTLIKVKHVFIKFIGCRTMGSMNKGNCSKPTKFFLSYFIF